MEVAGGREDCSEAADFLLVAYTAPCHRVNVLRKPFRPIDLFQNQPCARDLLACLPHATPRISCSAPSRRRLHAPIRAATRLLIKHLAGIAGRISCLVPPAPPGCLHGRIQILTKVRKRHSINVNYSNFKYIDSWRSFAFLLLRQEKCW